MGKNQGFKATQRAKHTSSEGGGGAADAVDGLVDASWHTPEWHAARIAALQVERLPWDEWKRRQKEEEARQALVAGEDERMMQEYRAQLAADREKRLSRGTNHTELREKVKSKHKDKKKKKDKKKEDKKKEEKKSRKSDKSSKRKREKSPKAKKSRKKRRRDGSKDGSGTSSSSSDSSDSDDEGGPIRLSEYLKG